MTASAKTATECMVVLFAIRESLMLKEVAVVERHLTLLAHKAVGMPLQVQRGDVVLCNWGVAAAALGGELLEVAGLAEGGVVLLVETVVAELVAALGAEEVLRVEGLVEGGDALVQDWALAVTAPEVRMILRKKEEKGETRPWTKETVVVLLTVRSALSLKEVLGAQLLIDCGSSNHLFQSPWRHLVAMHCNGCPRAVISITMMVTWLQWVQVKCSGCHVWPRAVIT